MNERLNPRMAICFRWLVLLLILELAAPSEFRDLAGAGHCGRHTGIYIHARWNTAIASYDAMARSMWLEFDIQDTDSRQVIREECLVALHGREFEAHVMLDDRLAARTRDSEAGVIIESVGLGRHWLVIKLLDTNGREITRQLAEFTLPWHAHIRISEPPNRHHFPVPEDTTAEIRTCFRLVPSGTQ